MSEYLTKEEIIELLKCNKYTNDFFSIYSFEGFLTRYGVNNDINVEELKDIKRSISDAYSTSTYIYYPNSDEENKDSFKYEKLINIFANKLEENNLKIKWYSHDFWSLFSFKENGNSNQDWENGTLGYTMKKEERVALVNFLKKAPDGGFDKFDELTTYLSKMYCNYCNNTELVVYWLSLATKKENKEKLSNISCDNIYRFVEALGLSEKETMLLRKIEATSLFTKDKPALIKKLKSEMDYSLIKKHPNIVEFIINKINDLGEKLEMPTYNIIEEDKTEIVYSAIKTINLQGIVAQKIADYNTAEKAIKLLSAYLGNKLEQKGIRFEEIEKTTWITSLQSHQPVIQFRASSEYEFRLDEMKELMSNVLEMGIEYLLKYDKEAIDYYSSKDIFISDFFDFFDEYRKVKKNYIDLKVELEKSENNNIKSVNLNKI